MWWCQWKEKVGVCLDRKEEATFLSSVPACPVVGNLSVKYYCLYWWLKCVCERLAVCVWHDYGLLPVSSRHPIWYYTSGGEHLHDISSHVSSLLHGRHVCCVVVFNSEWWEAWHGVSVSQFMKCDDKPCALLCMLLSCHEVETVETCIPNIEETIDTYSVATEVFMCLCCGHVVSCVMTLFSMTAEACCCLQYGVGMVTMWRRPSSQIGYWLCICI